MVQLLVPGRDLHQEEDQFTLVSDQHLHYHDVVPSPHLLHVLTGLLIKLSYFLILIFYFVFFIVREEFLNVLNLLSKKYFSVETVSSTAGSWQWQSTKYFVVFPSADQYSTRSNTWTFWSILPNQTNCLFSSSFTSFI